MSKFGWDLPPGCKMSDIPGNRAEDLADEQIRDNIEAALRPLKLDEDSHHRQDTIDEVVENLFKLINNAHESGYKQCQSDADEAIHYKALQQNDNMRLDPDFDRQHENEKRIHDEEQAP